MARGKSNVTWKRILAVLVLVGLFFLGSALFRVGDPPAIRIESALPAIGKRTQFHVVVEQAGRGLGSVQAAFVQGERVEILETREFVPREPWQYWGPRTRRVELDFEVGRERLEGLEEGPATIRITAERPAAWLSRPDAAVEVLELPVKLRPPQLQVKSSHIFVAQGGCEAVVYSVGDDSVRDGVQSGENWFPGYPLPGGGAGERFALFGAAFDLEDKDSIRLIAVDNVGNESTQSFVDRLLRKPFRNDTIRLSEKFMARVVPAIMAQTPELRDEGDLLANYLQINNRLRVANTEELIALSAESRPEFLWNRTFVPMKGAKVTSDFADRRSYIFEGEIVDRQDHLGFDLATVSRDEVQAANDGVVLLAHYLGIYGNTVVIDHGYGLLSLYGHLSEIGVEVGQEVERGVPIGRSGKTGLAGGDHLHFTMLLHGLSVNPREWWDDHWIHDRLQLKLGDALDFQG